MKRFLCVAAIAAGLAGCTNAGVAQFSALGTSFKVTVYSGGVVVREFTSSGKVLAEEDSDGWYFMDAKTGKLVRISGVVVVEQL